MHRLGGWLWTLPWPIRLRRLAEPIVNHGAFQRFIIPHFRCGVVGVIQNERGEYLLLKHTYRTNFPWGLPTGFLEHGEQPAHAIHREVCEEAGLNVEISGLWCVYVDERSILNLVFRGHASGQHFRPSAEISAAGFYSLDALPPMLPAQRHLLSQDQKEATLESPT